MNADTLQLWPVIVEDTYVPEVAPVLLSALRGLDDESAAMSVRLAALDAELEAWGLRN